jgi:hypothetical protein
MLLHGSLENRIGGQDVNLPAFRMGDVAQPQNNASRSTEPGVADNV